MVPLTLDAAVVSSAGLALFVDPEPHADNNTDAQSAPVIAMIEDLLLMVRLSFMIHSVISNAVE